MEKAMTGDGYGGLPTGGAHLAATCQGPSPPPEGDQVFLTHVKELEKLQFVKVPAKCSCVYDKEFVLDSIIAAATTTVEVMSSDNIIVEPRILLDSDYGIEWTFEVAQKHHANYKAGVFPVAHRVFDEMLEWNIISYHALFSGYAAPGDINMDTRNKSSTKCLPTVLCTSEVVKACNSYLPKSLPEFLNCNARTSLDMFAKHYNQAATSWVVIFVLGKFIDINLAPWPLPMQHEIKMKIKTQGRGSLINLSYFLGVDCYHVEKKQQQPELATVMEQQQKVLAGFKGFWEQMEPYFCEFTAEEFKELLPKRQVSAAQIDPCVFIPVVGSDKELGENLNPSHPPAPVADDSSGCELEFGHS
jgi:hypothetical protein